MMEPFFNIWKIPELRRRLIFTLLMLAVYRVGAFIPIPGVDPGALHEFMTDIRGQAGGTALDFVDMFTGGAMSKMAIFAMGIMPYISASIILQLLTVVVPTLERLSKEGEVGRRKITRYTRYLTGVIAAFQATGIALLLTSQTTGAGRSLVPNPGVLFWFITILTLSTGTVLIMWLGEQISERGIGNGISLIIFAGIVARFPAAVSQTTQRVNEGTLSLLQLIVLVGMMVGIIALIVFVERAQRRIPVQYAKRVVGRRVRAGQTTHLPLKLNTAGVIPVIFAQSVIVLPSMLLALVPPDITWARVLASQLGYAMPLYVVLETLAIIFFCFFYTSIVFNPVDTTDNIKKYGGFIPGIRPGKKTAEYIDTVLTRLTFWGALYLSLISLAPMLLTSGIRLHELPRILGGGLFQGMPNWFKAGLALPDAATSFFGGTSMLIVVGVCMDFVQQVESQLIMRHYDGFLRGTRIRGRRG
jgi:preprotein translocase subunit SecY